MCVESFHETVTESDLSELFRLRAKNYLKENCSIKMS